MVAMNTTGIAFAPRIHRTTLLACGVAVRHLGKILRSVRAFGRELTATSPGLRPGKMPAIGVALGGGFARGIAHIGVLKVLEEENIPVAYEAVTKLCARHPEWNKLLASRAAAA